MSPPRDAANPAQRILKSELCSLTWLFRYKGRDDDTVYMRKFNEDFTLRTEGQSGLRHWQFVDYREGEGATQIKVGDYPPQTFSRKPDGKWMCHNDLAWHEQA